MQQTQLSLRNTVERHFKDLLWGKITDRVGTPLCEHMWQWQADQWMQNQYPILNQTNAQIRADFQ
jgi:hypothetical protein